jgi:hypothetical protein
MKSTSRRSLFFVGGLFATFLMAATPADARGSAFRP